MIAINRYVVLLFLFYFFMVYLCIKIESYYSCLVLKNDNPKDVLKGNTLQHINGFDIPSYFGRQTRLEHGFSALDVRF